MALEIHNSGTFKSVITFFSSSLENPKNSLKGVTDGQVNIKEYVPSVLLSVCFCVLSGFVQCS